MSTECEMAEIGAIIDAGENGTKDIKLLHCNTEHPTLKTYLKAMQTMRDTFGLR